jgi:hypothetical protein
MRKLHILVEGQTEKVVVDDIIKQYLSDDDLHVTTSILTTKLRLGTRHTKAG